MIAALVALGTGIGAYSARYYGSPAQEPIEGLLWPDPKPIQPFLMADQDGREFGLERLRGKWSFLFFGYTHCPDVCPITLSVLKQFERDLKSEAGAPVQVVFVSVDPERDTPRQVAEYVRYFSSDFIGLGGTIGQIQTLSSQFGVAFYQGERTATGDYTVDHSAAVFLTDVKGRLVAIFSAPHNATAMLLRFRQIRDFLRRADA